MTSSFKLPLSLLLISVLPRFHFSPMKSWRSALSCFSSSLQYRSYQRSALSRLSLSDEISVDSFVPYSQDTKNAVKAGHVYFVATPIGNLGDISLRAMKVLEAADVIVAEDTRHTSRLLRLLALPHLNRVMISHHEHNQRESIDLILAQIKQGKAVAVVSDAGTPGISDPGSSLASALARHSVPLHPVPGASAVVSALSVSGFPCRPFSFFGFLAVKGQERSEALAAIASPALASHTIALYEAPHRILKTMQSLASLSEETALRPLLCCRELTKRFEELQRGSVREVLERLERGQIEARGEFTLVLGPVLRERREDIDWDLLRRPSSDLLAEASKERELFFKIREALEAERVAGASKKEAIKRVADLLSLPKKVVYSIALKISWEEEEEV